MEDEKPLHVLGWNLCYIMIFKHAFLAFDLTGCYYNPTLATDLELGCLMEDETTLNVLG
jgi:hypothetical protein